MQRGIRRKHLEDDHAWLLESNRRMMLRCAETSEVYVQELGRGPL